MSPQSLAWKPFRDRRQHRAITPLLAAEYYLDRVRERCELPAIVLSRGREVLAGSGDDLAGLADKGADVLEGASDVDLGDDDLFAHQITIGGESWMLASRGGRVDRLRTLQLDLQRILA